MQTVPVNVAPPGDAVIREALQRATGQPVWSVERTPNPDAGVLASELLGCTFSDGTRRHFFCKHGSDGSPSEPAPRYGTVGYEARVYQRVLGAIDCGHSPYVGVGRDERTGTTTILLEHLAAHERVDRSADTRRAMRQAARWLGAFHATAERALAGGSSPPLVSFDGPYYWQWANRARLFTGGMERRYPWLTGVLDRFELVVEALLARPLTVVHGDFYADNVLVRDGAVTAIDWSWAAIGAGEIDLASLTERWPDEYVAACTDEYLRARWPAVRDADAARRAVGAARVYLCCRWLGHREDWVRDERRQWRFDALRAAADQMGIL